MYCVQADLEAQIPVAALVRLTDDERTGAVNTARIDKAIANAGVEIDGYCQTKYPVPFNPVPDVIRKLAVDIALYNLLSRRGFEEDSADRAIVERYKAAVKFLENLARGVVRIGTPTPAPASEVRVEGPPRVFSRDKLRQF